MAQIFTIPEHDEEFNTGIIILNLDTKEANVQVARTVLGGGTMTEHKIIDVIPLFQSEMSVAEITAFRKGLKLIVADAWGKTLTDITGDIL